MKPSPISVAILVVSLLLAPALLAQSPGSANQSAVSPAPSSASAAEVPRLIKFSGTLLDAQDRPMAGPVGVTFALHAQQTGGAALWLETQNVTPDAHGAYTILLGANSTNGVPAELFASGEARWLEVQVERQAEQPRILLVSVPYALKAKDAETLGGRPASAFLTTETLAGAGSSAGAAAASPTLSAALPSSKTQTIPKNAASTPQPATACTSVTSGGTATVNSIALFNTACSIGSSLMTQALINGFPGVNVAGNNAGLLLNGTGTHQVTLTGLSSGRLGQDFTGFFFSSDTKGKVIKFLTNNGALNEQMRIDSAGNVGIGTTTPVFKLDVNGNQNIAGNLSLTGTANITAFGGSFVGSGGGLFGHDTSPSGNTVGVQGVADSTGGAGVVGTSTAAMGQAAGVRGFAASSGGAGVYGQATLGNGVTAGVRGVASSPSGRGVSGDMVSATANTAIAGGSGVAGTYGFNQDGSINASATGGVGVFGQNTTTNGTGVYGSATATSGATIGVRGDSASLSGAGGYFTNSAGGFMLAAVDSGGKPILAADPNGAYVNTAVFSSNNDATGTVLNKLVKYTSADTVSVTGAGDPGGAIGIVVSGAGTAGKAVVAYFGEAHCFFDTPTPVVADYVQISQTAAGECHDAGPGYPANGQQVLGRVTKPGSAPPKVFLFGGAETRPGGGGGAITAVNTPAGGGLMGGVTSGAANLSLVNTCGSGQVLQWNGTAWVCASVSSAAGVTSVAAGTGMIASPGNPIISSGTLAINPAVVPQLGVVNTFTANQTINSGGTALTATSSITSGAVVSGTASSTADNANDNGVQGVTASPIGIGVNGLAQDTTGGTTKALGSVGVNGQSNSPNGIGVIGLATDTTAVVVGTSPNQGTIGVQGQSDSPNGIGVNAFDNYQCLLPGCDPSATVAAPVGLKAQVLHADGIAVQGTAGSKTVGCAMPTCDPTRTGSVGVLGRSFHPNGVGTYGIANDTSVTNTAGLVFSVGVIGQAKSPTGYALYANFIPATVDVGAAALFNNNAGLTAVPQTKLCTGQANCTILELQANFIRKFHFDGAGNAHAAGAFMAGGADFAESVSVRGERRLYDAGDVMVIDDAGNRSLAKSQEPYSTLVAGIVSTKPGVLASLHNSTTSAGQKAIEAEVPLAVVGIVPCKVSAENGPIHAGDLLVTSSIAGYAMKGIDRARMLGAVVGKAMQPLQSGKGIIEVLVTLQ
jgi:hypothetical protein